MCVIHLIFEINLYETSQNLNLALNWQRDSVFDMEMFLSGNNYGLHYVNRTEAKVKACHMMNC